MSAHQHLKDDVFIDGLYGLVDVEALVGTCPLCASRWNQLQEKRAAVAVPLAIPAEELAAQRRSIFARVERSTHVRWAGSMVAAAAAATCLLAIGVFVHHPLTAVHPAPASLSETQPLSDVYSDVYSLEQSFEPTASASFRVLFEADGTPAEGPEQGTKR